MSNIHYQPVSNTTPATLELAGTQDVRVAGALHRALIELLTPNDNVKLDCTGVSSFDAAALQLLLAAKRENADRLDIIAPAGSDAETWFRLAGMLDRFKP